MKAGLNKNLTIEICDNRNTHFNIYSEYYFRILIKGDTSIQLPNIIVQKIIRKKGAMLTSYNLDSCPPKTIFPNPNVLKSHLQHKRGRLR